MGARSVLRMVLYGKDRVFLMPYSLNAVVVEVYMGNLYLIRVQAFGVYTEAVILGGDFDLAGGQILDRLVGATVAELQLECLTAIGQTQHLVT